MRFRSLWIGVHLALAPAALCAAAAGAVVSSDPAYSSLARLYDYDASAPLGAREGDFRTEGTLRIVSLP